MTDSLGSSIRPSETFHPEAYEAISQSLEVHRSHTQELVKQVLDAVGKPPWLICRQWFIK